jgi:hypothetical protein
MIVFRYIERQENSRRERMNIEVGWDNTENTAVLLRYHIGWRLQDLDIAFLEVNSLFESVPHPVDLIIDISNAGQAPRDTQRRFREIVSKKHRNIRKVVFVGGRGFISKVLTTITNLLSQIYQPPDLLFAENIEDARILLFSTRSSNENTSHSASSS